MTQGGDHPIAYARADGSLRPPHLGIGAGLSGRVIGRDGVPVPGLAAMGPLRRGDGWETTALPEIRRHGHRVATTVSADTRRRRAAAWEHAA